MKAKTLGAKVEVSSDGEGLVSHAGAFLLSELADRIGLTEALSEAMAPTRQRQSAHDPGEVLRDVIVAIADGGECVTDLGVLAGQQPLFGEVASSSTAHRVIGSIGPAELEAIGEARALARASAWQAGAAPAGPLIVDIDATLIGSHSEKEAAAGNYKGGFGFHPLLAYLDSGDALAAILRPGNAAANHGADHTELLGSAIGQLPESERGRELLLRCDSAGQTHELTDACRQARVRFSVGFELRASVREAILALPESAWEPAIEPDGSLREGAAVAELAELDLESWPAGCRLICRRERPHPGAQLSFTDHEGHRFTCFLTDCYDGSLAELELRHRRRARVEDRIRTGKDAGMAKFPFAGFAANEAWLELSLCAQDLLGFVRRLLLAGELAGCEPKRMRQRLLHLAGRIARSGRRLILRLPRGWPWAEALVAAFKRLRSLPTAAPA